MERGEVGWEVFEGWKKLVNLNNGQSQDLPPPPLEAVTKPESVGENAESQPEDQKKDATTTPEEGEVPQQPTTTTKYGTHTQWAPFVFDIVISILCRLF